MFAKFVHTIFLILFAFSLSAQNELRYIMPAGGSAGKQVEMEVSTRLAGVQRMIISGSGANATFLGPVKRRTTDAKGKRVEQVVTGRFRFMVTIEPDAEPGVREVRVGNKTMLSLPLPFTIDLLSEELASTTVEGAEVVTVDQMPLYLNGSVYRVPGVHKFAATEGAQLVAYCDKHSGGWSGSGLPEITFADSDDKICSDVKLYDSPMSRIAVLQVPKTGEYILKVAISEKVKNPVRSAYRFKFGELPVITGFNPATARPGESLNVRLQGFNLVQRRVRLFTGGKDSALCQQALAGDALVLPGVSFELQREVAADFELFMEPATVNLPANGSVALTVYAERFGGFDGAIAVDVDYPPLSISCEGGIIPAGADKCMMTISTEGVRFPRVPFALSLSGSAEINGAEVLRPVQVVYPVVTAEDESEKLWRTVADCMVQARLSGNAMRIDPGALASRSPRLIIELPVTYSAPQPLGLKGANKLSLTSSALAEGLAVTQKYELFVLWPERGFEVETVVSDKTRGEVDFVVKCSGKLLKAGDRGSLILGCRVKGGADGAVPLAVSQSMPYIIK